MGKLKWAGTVVRVAATNTEPQTAHRVFAMKQSRFKLYVTVTIFATFRSVSNETTAQADPSRPLFKHI